MIRIARPFRTSKFMVSSALSAAKKKHIFNQGVCVRNSTHDAVQSLKSECKKDKITMVSGETRNTLGTSWFTSLLALQCKLAVGSFKSADRVDAFLTKEKMETQYELRVHSKVLRQRDTQTNSTDMKILHVQESLSENFKDQCLCAQVCNLADFQSRSTK